MSPLEARVPTTGGERGRVPGARRFRNIRPLFLTISSFPSEAHRLEMEKAL